MPCRTSECVSLVDLIGRALPRILFGLFVSGIILLLPQKIPFEYFPLNNPSAGLQYLEMTCATDVKSISEIFLDTGRNFNDIEKIQWPMGPSDTVFTYTFPLPDAPLYRLRFVPFSAKPGKFTFVNFRIINRKRREIRSFTQDSFSRNNRGGSISNTIDGWQIGARDGEIPQFIIALTPPLFAEGMTMRNFQRSLISTSYLALMLWIVSLAVYLAFMSHRTPGAALGHIVFLFFLSICFSLVGNRGLIQNSVRSAWAQAKEHSTNQSLRR